MSFVSRRTVVIVIAAAALLAAFWTLRHTLGIGLNPSRSEPAVDRLGVWGPLAFVAIVALRIPLAVPSAIVLIGGGVIFGSVEGTLYGAVGLLISAIAAFLGSRWAGRAASRGSGPDAHAVPVRPGRLAHGRARGRAGHRVPAQRDHVVAPGRGRHEHVAARVRDRGGHGSLGRAALYTYFGSRLVDADPIEMLGVGALFAVAMLLPLAFPRRARGCSRRSSAREPR
jgi:uncharacterized membrane protein YdjX (TVP38/TMEM64 family)